VWIGPMLERDWKAFSALITESEVMGPAVSSDYEIKNGGIIVVSDGDPARSCPLWSDIEASGKVETVMGVNEFADCAAKIPINHPANLLEVFPTPRRLDRFIVTMALAGIAAFLTLGANSLNDNRRYQSVENAAQHQIAALKLRLDDLKKNQREMLFLRSQVLDSSKLLPIGKHAALMALATAVPESMILTSFSIGRNGNFEVGALFYGDSFSPEHAREVFKNYGFSPDHDNGWMYDSRNATLYVRGQYVEKEQ